MDIKIEKLGTHNSLSYLVPQWWLRLFNFIGKCQNLTIKEQFDFGVRYFDIRVKYNKNNVAKSGHGLLNYNILIDDVLNLLNIYAYNNKCKVIVRLFLENNKCNPRKHDNLFIKDIKYWINTYTNINFVEGGCRYDYKRFIEKDCDINVCYAEYWKMKFCIPFPKLWAKRNNKDKKENLDKYKYNVFDFIEL